MRQEVEFILPPIVLIALFLVVISEYCTPTPVSQLITSINPNHSFDPFCYVKSFEPEDPEFGRKPTPLRNSAYYVTASGTATASTAGTDDFERWRG